MSRLTLALQAIQAILQGITQANGYATDIGNSVVLEDQAIDDGSQERCLLVWEEVKTSRKATTLRTRNVTVVAEVSVPVSWDQFRGQLDAMVDDVQNAIPAVKSGVLDASTEYEAEVLGARGLRAADGALSVVAQVLIEMRLRERI